MATSQPGAALPRAVGLTVYPCRPGKLTISTPTSVVPYNTARRHPKRLLDVGKRVVVHRLARKRDFVEMVAIAVVHPSVFEQTKDRGCRRHVGDLELLQRFDDPPGLELAGVARDVETECQRGNGAMPEPMPPRR